MITKLGGSQEIGWQQLMFSIPVNPHFDDWLKDRIPDWDARDRFVFLSLDHNQRKEALKTKVLPYNDFARQLDKVIAEAKRKPRTNKSSSKCRQIEL